MLCQYILRPPLANGRLHLLEDGTRSIRLKPVALLPTLYLVGAEGGVFKLDNYYGKASNDSLRARL